MNLLGHAHVALAQDDDPDFVLGALLPDLASMARVRITARTLLGPAVDRGVAYHLRTDAVFHTLPGFVEGSAQIRRELLARGLGRGPARAVDHVGWELLLDGTLVGSVAETAFHTCLDRADAAGAALHRPERWTHLLSYRPQLRQLRYDDPEWVATRLERIFHDRPLLRFSPSQLGVVAEVLTAAAPSIAAAAPSILAATASGVEAPA